ncbi:MAG: hypothetical protein ABI678_03445, partial [Kofleriaceae bacterium]
TVGGDGIVIQDHRSSVTAVGPAACAISCDDLLGWVSTEREDLACSDDIRRGVREHRRREWGWP